MDDLNRGRVVEVFEPEPFGPGQICRGRWRGEEGGRGEPCRLVITEDRVRQY